MGSQIGQGAVVPLANCGHGDVFQLWLAEMSDECRLLGAQDRLSAPER